MKKVEMQKRIQELEHALTATAMRLESYKDKYDEAEKQDKIKRANVWCPGPQFAGKEYKFPTKTKQ
jgi:hypothetical protein